MRMIIILLSCAILSVACTKKPVTKVNELIVGTSPTYPPYESMGADGKPEGFDIDVVMAIGKKLNRKVVLKDMGFDALILGLKQNKFDMLISGMSITAAREKEIAMIPYQGEPMKSYTLIFWDKIPDGVKGLSDLSSKTVAVQSGTHMEEYLGKNSTAVSKALESTPELVMDIKYGKSVAAFVESHIARDLVKKHPNIQSVEVMLPENLWVKGNGIGIKKENVKLQQEIQNAVNALRQEGVIKQLEDKWLTK